MCLITMIQHTKYISYPPVESSTESIDNPLHEAAKRGMRGRGLYSSEVKTPPCKNKMAFTVSNTAVCVNQNLLLILLWMTVVLTVYVVFV